MVKSTTIRSREPSRSAAEFAAGINQPLSVGPETARDITCAVLSSITCCVKGRSST